MDKDIFRWFADILYSDALKVEEKYSNDFKQYFVATLELEYLGYTDGALVIRAISDDGLEDALIKLYQQTKEYRL